MTDWIQNGPDFAWPAGGKAVWRLAATRGGAGLSLLGPSGDSLATAFVLPQLLAAEPPLVEHYQRPGSLVVRYGATDKLPLEVLLQLKPDQVGPASVVELVLSMQTELLDAPPLKIATFALPDGKPVSLPRACRTEAGTVPLAFASQFAAENRVVVLSSTPDSATCLVVVHPGDLSWMSVESLAEGHGVECRLRCGNLEKGVIRRMRFLMAAFPGQPDQSKAMLSSMDAIASQFERSELPLSA